MLRLVGFFVLVFFVLHVLRVVLEPVPVIGALFRVPLLSFWLTAVLVSVAISKLTADALDRRRRGALIRQLGAVDTPHNMGKLASLFVAQRRYRRALPYLEKAVAGEPEVAEWHYRKGQAHLGLRQPDAAIESLSNALRIEEEHAYGAALMRYAEAQQHSADPGGSLESIERFERNHGPNPESAYRRGLALRALGRKTEALAALREVPRLARQAARYQKKLSTGWVLKAALARYR